MELTINWVNSILEDPKSDHSTLTNIFNTYGRYDYYPEQTKVLDGLVKHRQTSTDTLQDVMRLVNENLSNTSDIVRAKELTGIRDSASKEIGARIMHKDVMMLRGLSFAQQAEF